MELAQEWAVTCAVGNKAGEMGLSEDIGAQTILPSPALGARHKIVRFGGVCPTGFQSFFFFFGSIFSYYVSVLLFEMGMFILCLYCMIIYWNNKAFNKVSQI